MQLILRNAEVVTVGGRFHADIGVRDGRISAERFVAVSATNPAKLFGLYPRKGAVAVGADADLVVWDDDRVRTIDGAAMHSRADYSPYDGFEVRGWPKWVVSRGEVVVEDGAVVPHPWQSTPYSSHPSIFTVHSERALPRDCGRPARSGPKVRRCSSGRDAGDPGKTVPMCQAGSPVPDPPVRG